MATKVKQGWLRDHSGRRAANGCWLLVVMPATKRGTRGNDWVMALFLSTFEKQIDKKGRISVPVPFRNALAGQSFHGIIAYASFVNPCIEACGMDRIEKLHEQIEALDPFSEERDALATTILGGSVQLGFDGEGRVMLPPALIEEASVTDKCVFVGKGATFEIWEPKAFADYEATSRRLAREKRLALRADSLKGGAA